MRADRGWHDGIGGERLDQSRIMPAEQRRKVARSIDQFMAEARGRLACRLMPEALAPGFQRGRGQPLGGLDMSPRKTRQRYSIRDQQPRQSPAAGLEPGYKPRQAASFAGESSPDASEARSGTRSSAC